MQTDNFIQRAVRAFSPFERLLFALFVLTTSTSGLALLYTFNDTLLVDIPAPGGSITEGVIGSPRFINPVLASSDADRDLTALIYTGLMRISPSGELRPSLAERYSISNDGLTYDFVLRNDIIFQDGDPVTADDVIFTIQAIQNQAIKSPWYANWEGIGVQRISEHEVRFILPEPYAPFLENTTIGILPKHIWASATADEFPLSNHNISAVGAGPYYIKNIVRTTSGIPQTYELAPFKNFAQSKPHISAFTIKFYRSENELINAYLQSDINALAGISPNAISALQKSTHDTDVPSIHKAPLPRVFGIFLNHNRVGAFIHPEVRRALALATPKNAIVENVLKGYGTVLDSPLPPGILLSSSATLTPETSVEEASDLLRRNGWERDENTGVWEKESEKGGTDRLAFTLSTTNAPELKAVGEQIVAAWRSLGVSVDLKVFEPTDLTQSIIRPRRYDALLFGEVIGREPDLYAFWHSSQISDPGLNIALYANISTDKLLESARTSLVPSDRLSLYQTFDSEIRKDSPAIFLYAPDLIYVLPADVKNVSLARIATPDDRFENVNEWYINTDRVWPFLKRILK